MIYTIDTHTWRSPNYTNRTEPIESIVVHSCEGALPHPRSTSLPWLCDPVSKVSTHYYVCRPEPDGRVLIYQLVDDAHVAWHAGGKQDDGTWTAQPRFSNPRSIGVECEHRAGQTWPAEQKEALAWLLRLLMTTHHIPVTTIETHGQIALPGPYDRKHDPSDWPHADFIVWRGALSVPPPPSVRAYRVAGLPMYQRQDLTGPLAGVLPSGDTVLIDATYANGAGHDTAGRGFVDMDGLEAL